MAVSLQELVDSWLALDKNAETRQEIEILWKAGNTDELEKRMRSRIQFGTAGLRGRMEAGWARMNDLIIIQASQGLCEYVLKHVQDAASRGIVVGHDHRYHSEHWAKLTASVFVNRGVKAYLLRGLVHTPMVPFSVHTLNAACGVMITASHNPKQDNGYKVYWENAVQIIEPHDKGIADSIEGNLEPQTWSTDSLLASPLCIDRTEEMKEEYFKSISHLSVSREKNSVSKIKFINTSMHGVSDPFVTKAFQICKFSPYIAVKEQQQADPEFPTVKFPNPEEKGALDLAIQTADKEGSHCILAQDPDSDRFAAAQKIRNGKWVQLTGDQLGTLFAYRVLQLYKESGKPLNKLAMVASTVSSKMIEKIADVEGFKFKECLTGFKYIGNTALDLVKEGYEVPFGYEEAIGYMFGSTIRDKDGVAATITFAELVVSLEEAGKTALGLLEDLYTRYGYFQTSNSYFICNEPAKIDAIFSKLRSFNSLAPANSPLKAYPTHIAGLEVTSVVDLTTGYDTTNAPSFKPSLPLSSGHMIQFRAENKQNGTKIVLTLRTSGTEPKIKYYLEGNGADPAAVSAMLPQVVEELGQVWMEADKHNLGRP